MISYYTIADIADYNTSKGGTRSPPAIQHRLQDSKFAIRAFQKGQQSLERDLGLFYWALQTVSKET